MSNIANVNDQMTTLMLNNSQQDVSSGDSKDWYIAFANAWGKTLDRSAEKIIDLSGKIDAGDDSLATTTELTAQSQRLSFTATCAATSINAVGSGINTVARKQ